MVAFNFKLQKLLEIRLDKEEEVKNKLQIELNNKKSIENDLKKFILTKEKESLFTSNENIVERKIRMNYLHSLDEKITKCNIELRKSEINVNNIRKELVVCSKEVKTVEKLKEKKLDEYLKEVNRIEQIQNDEFALCSFIKKINSKEVK